MTRADTDRPSRRASVRAMAETARSAATTMASATRQAKDAALRAMAEALDRRRADILAANQADLDAAREGNLRRGLIDRLRFNAARIDSRIRSLRAIAELPDPVGEVFRDDVTDGGLHVRRVRVPLGVVLMIYEARPHVTVNAGAFCLKSGNAAILRGGSEARRCNALLGEMWRDALAAAGLPERAVQVISGSHEQIDELLQLDDLIDLVIPRGGRAMIDKVSRTSRIPVIKHSAGVCHVYVDASADVGLAVNVAVDSKCLMPEVCNAAETLLVHRDATDALKAVAVALGAAGVHLKGCPRTRERLGDIEPATEDDWTTEYLDLFLSIRVVDTLDEAIAHVNAYGSHHTDAIVTGDEAAATRFTERVDSAVVLVNASTMFCDGASLGMGAEIGISTDKLHARGPMGLEELTSYKFAIEGRGHVMGPPAASRKT